MTPKNVYVSLYVLNNRVKGIVQFDIDKLSAYKNGTLSDKDKADIQLAMEVALSKWELGDV